MAKQISISDDVYEMLMKVKGKSSFSETIKTAFIKKQKRDITKFFGILKNKRKQLEELKKQIDEEREKNYGRTFDW